MSPILESILQNLTLYKFDKEKNFFVTDFAKNLNPGTLKRFLAKKNLMSSSLLLMTVAVTNHWYYCKNLHMKKKIKG